MSKILVAEFNHVIPGMIKKCLQPLGHEVFSASHGEAALEVWKSVQPDLLMAGILLPGIDGYELIRRWKSGGGPVRPAILISGKSQAVDAVTAGQVGVDAIIQYPFKSVELTAMIDHVLEGAGGTPEVPEPEVESPAAALRPPPAASGTGRGTGSVQGGLDSLKNELMQEGLLDTGRARHLAPASSGMARPAPAFPPPVPVSRIVMPIRPPSPPAAAGDPTDQLRKVLHIKFQEVAETIIQALPAIIDKIIEEKLRKR